MLGPFQITLHARPINPPQSATAEVQGRPIRSLIVPAESNGTAFPTTFEATLAALEALPRMFIEPDGSFVWVSSHDENKPWQLDGALYDRNGHMLYVDLKGSCPPEAFDRILQSLGWPEAAVMVQLVREAVFVDEETFRGYAAKED